MNTKLLHAAFSFVVLPLVCAAAPEPAAAGWPCRWVWIFGWGLRADGDAGEIEAVIRTAARAGLNGAVLSAGLDTVCMGEPALYAIYEEEARLLAERLRPRRVLLNMDEIRMGGTCPACRGRDLGALLGECVTRQVEALRRHNPGVEVCIWSDMFDPNHNARGDYYLAEGDFAGSWRHVPKDLVMAVWGGAPRAESLRFFANEGFATLIACYYDADDLDDVRRWIDLAAATPRVRGFMYTPWQKKYALLGEFGELLRGK